jgi:isoleucyl-tRNA synthetase
MKWAAQQIQSFTDKQITDIEEGDYLLNPDYLKNDEEPVWINQEDIEISTNEIEGFEIAVKGNLTVALDLVLSPILMEEGFAREFINRIQNIRKESKFELTDRILIKVQERGDLKDIITNFKEYICAEILADQINFLPEISNGTNIEVNDETITVNVTQKGN